MSTLRDQFLAKPDQDFEQYLSGTNTLDALLTAYGDPGCEAVVLVTDGLPDQRPEEILDHVAYAAHGRPVHAIYLAHSETDTVRTWEAGVHHFAHSLTEQLKW